MTLYPKRLIEVDLPIKKISEHARREKSIRHGHISTLHIWWARRPLAACRAVICAALWPDPADTLCPEKFRKDAATIMKRFFDPMGTDGRDFNDPVELRRAMLDFIADFANWDNSTKKEYLETSRALTQSAHESLGGAPGTKPLVVDPFAGGGSIPLEALRVGADAFASDLNPVAVLLNKVVLEYIPKYGQRLADEVRKWGEWVKQEAEKELREFYPKDPDGATPIAYLWARTITCEGPGCGAEVPLMRSLWLAKKESRSVALRIHYSGGIGKAPVKSAEGRGAGCTAFLRCYDKTGRAGAVLPAAD
jgi:putative DNA methylase